MENTIQLDATNVVISLEDLHEVVVKAAHYINKEQLTGREALQKALVNHERAIEVRRARMEALEQAAVDDIAKHIPQEEREVTINKTPRTVNLVTKLTGCIYDGDRLAAEGML